MGREWRFVEVFVKKEKHYCGSEKKNSIAISTNRRRSLAINRLYVSYLQQLLRK